jgi:hypothetical protein
MTNLRSTSVLLVIAILLCATSASAQRLRPVQTGNGLAEAPLLEDEQGDIYTTRITVKFNSLVARTTKGQREVAVTALGGE